MPRILLAEDDDAVRGMLQATLERDGFDVVAVANVREALSRIASETFDALLSDLHMPHAGDGFTVVSAMRLQADEILVKPIEMSVLRERIHRKLANPAPYRRVATQSVASILESNLAATIQDWMTIVQHDEELTCVPLSFEARTGHLPNLIADLIYRLRLPQNQKATISVPARQHGDLRRQQGYSAAMVVEESRILQVSIFNTLQKNLDRVD